MVKIHLLMKKEEIDEAKMREGNKVAVVFDVLLATTTITSALNEGAAEVIPVMDHLEARQIAKEYKDGQYVLSGENRGKPIDGFLYPYPRILNEKIKGKSLILSTTNGTVAIKKASGAKRTYISSLLNNPAVAEKVRKDGLGDTLLVICSGTSGDVNLEDFYGAGHFISCLLRTGGEQIKLTDAAKAALLFYRGNATSAYEVLRTSHIGQIFENKGLLHELTLASQMGTIPITPVLKGEKIIVEHSKNIV